MRLLQRGSVDSPGPRVTPGFLSVLCAEGDDCTAQPSPNRVGETSGYRLALAEWMTSPEHPLTSRVVSTASGSSTSEPGLWPRQTTLARWAPIRLTRSCWTGWRWISSRTAGKPKRLHKLIMLSSVYRQSSKHTDNARSRSPRPRIGQQPAMADAGAAAGSRGVAGFDPGRRRPAGQLAGRTSRGAHGPPRRLADLANDEGETPVAASI
jgi:hypothetical protein